MILVLMSLKPGMSLQKNRQMKKSIWAVIAAKDEAKDISKVVKQARKYVDNVVVIDDGSADRTYDVATRGGAIALKHIVNLGKGAAIKTGVEYAISKGAKILVLLDADGQHEPSEIPKFIDKLKESSIVFGIRTRRKKMPAILKLGNSAINKLTLLLFGINIDDTQCGFRAFKADIYKKIKWESSGYPMESEMVANVGRKRLKYSTVNIGTIYSDKYKGTTIMDGIKIALNLLWWRISRW
jgi:glycosyltransferase involved in cell wall biosynthesis